MISRNIVVFVQIFQNWSYFNQHLEKAKKNGQMNKSLHFRQTVSKRPNLANYAYLKAKFG